MCDYCEPNEAGNLKWLRDDPDVSAWLEDYNGGWGIVTSVYLCDTGCTTEAYVQVNNCPKCGRKLDE